MASIPATSSIPERRYQSSGKPEEVVSAINRIQIKSVLLEIAKDALYEKMSDSVKESINAASATQEAMFFCVFRVFRG